MGPLMRQNWNLLTFFEYKRLGWSSAAADEDEDEDEYELVSIRVRSRFSATAFMGHLYGSLNILSVHLFSELVHMVLNGRARLMKL